MATRYSSFLIRLHLLERGERIDVEHVQTGAKTREPSLEAAVIWMRAQTEAIARASPDTPGAAERNAYENERRGW
jgi:hypothetical protein